MTPRGTAAPLTHPATEELDLLRILHALSDPTRMEIVALLAQDGERACGTFPVDVAASTLSHHFKVLREAGLVHQRLEGRERITSLRTQDLEACFPGLIPSLLQHHTGKKPNSTRT